MRFLLPAAALLLAAGAAAGEGPPGDARPRPLPLLPRPRAALVDCRSPVVAHEAPVAAGAEFPLGDSRLVFARKGESWSVEVRRPDRALPDRVHLARLPALAEVTAFGGPYGISVRADPGGGGLLVSSAQGAPIPVGRETAHVVDSDRDGVLGGAGDGLVAPGCRTVAPFAGEAWHADAAVRVERGPGGGRDAWTVADLPMPRPGDADHGAAWRLLNWRRQQCGMAPAVYDASLEDGLRKHAAYCRRNGYQGHDEVEGRPGCTPEGAAAGKGSVLAYPDRGETLRDQIQVQVDTLYHRSQVLAGGLARTCLVLHEGMFGMRTTPDDEAPLHDRPLVFPPHGMRDAPREFHRAGEHPMPFDGFRPFRGYGACVAVYLPALHWEAELPAPPELSLAGADGAAVAGRFQFPGRAPAGASPHNYGNVALVPAEPLAPNALHRARARVPLPDGTAFAYDWEFTTGK